MSPAAAARPANAFTVDVEDYFHVAALSSVITRDSWATREYRVEANTERLLALLAEHQVQGPSSCSAGGRAFPRLGATYRARRSRDRLYGFSHQLVYRQSPEEFRAETTAPRGTSKTSSAGVLGYRARASR